MLTLEENELLIRVGPGTRMGNLLRRYWIPALLPEELPEPGGPQVRVRLLGEDLIALRASDGRLALLLLAGVAQVLLHGRTSFSFHPGRAQPPAARWLPRP